MIEDESAIRQVFLRHNYEFVKQIGRGGYSTVYLARSLVFSQFFVIKKISLNMKTKDSIVDNEVSVLMKLSHPFIIKMYETFKDDIDFEKEMIDEAENEGFYSPRKSESNSNSNVDDSNLVGIGNGEISANLNNNNNSYDINYNHCTNDVNNKINTMGICRANSNIGNYIINHGNRGNYCISRRSSLGIRNNISQDKNLSFSIQSNDTDDSGSYDINISNRQNRKVSFETNVNHQNSNNSNNSNNFNDKQINNSNSNINTNTHANTNNNNSNNNNGDLYIVLEYCENGSLNDWINEKGALTSDEFSVFGKAIISALNECHTHNISHRDIKPGNILLDKYNRVRLADFGLSHSIEEGQKEILHNGSLEFMAPEVLDVNSCYDPFLADIWSLGICFYFMVCGELPFIGDRDSIKNQIKIGLIEFPNHIADDIDPRIRYLILQMTRLNPLQRLSLQDILKNPVFRPLKGEKPPCCLKLPNQLKRKRIVSSSIGPLAQSYIGKGRRISLDNTSVKNNNEPNALASADDDEKKKNKISEDKIAEKSELDDEDLIPQKRVIASHGTTTKIFATMQSKKYENIKNLNMVKFLQPSPGRQRAPRGSLGSLPSLK